MHEEDQAAVDALPTVSLLNIARATSVDATSTSKKERKKCAVYFCAKVESPKCPFMSFPKDTKRCLRWIERCNNPAVDAAFVINGAKHLFANFSVCIHHFTEEDFKDPTDPDLGLKPNAVPSLRMEPRDANGLITISPEAMEAEYIETYRRLLDSIDEKKTEVKVSKAIKYFRIYKRLMGKLKKELRWNNKRKKTGGRPHRKSGTAAFAILENLPNSFVLSELHRLMERNQDRVPKRYTGEDKCLALALYHCSTRAYGKLRGMFSLPSVSLLTKFAEEMAGTKEYDPAMFD